MTPEENERIAAALRKHPDEYLQQAARNLHIQDPAPDREGLVRQLVSILALDEVCRDLLVLVYSSPEDAPLLAVSEEGWDRESFGWFVGFDRRDRVLTLLPLELGGEDFHLLITSSMGVRECRPPLPPCETTISDLECPDLDLS